MTRPLRNVSTLLIALACALPLAPARDASAQILKLASLRMYRSDVVGPWVSYKVRTRSGRSPVREFRQRVAIVGLEKVGGENGYWVELKTIDRAGTRIERGLFAPSSRAGDDELDEPTDEADPGLGRSPEPLRLVRYQMLAPGGKLYEYPVSSATSTRAAGGVSAFELFEFDPRIKPIRRFLGPDTLRLGRRVVPSVLEWTSRTGSDDWVMEDSASVYQLVLTQTFWRNAAVPITGFAQSLFRVTTRKAPPRDSTVAGAPPALPDTSMAFAPADTTTGPTSMSAGEGRLLSWTQLVLEDLGADAVAEVTQKPEPAPVSEHGVPADLIR